MKRQSQPLKRGKGCVFLKTQNAYRHLHGSFINIACFVIFQNSCLGKVQESCHHIETWCGSYPPPKELNYSFRQLHVCYFLSEHESHVLIRYILREKNSETNASYVIRRLVYFS